MLRREMAKEAGEAAGDLGIPFIPGVAAGFCVELVGEMALVETRCETAVGFEERFICASGEIEVRRLSWIGRLD